jgi:predicted choloylglycine hydrolase
VQTEDTFQRIECRGTPRAMGRQYGEACRDAIAHTLALRKVADAKALAPFAERARRLLTQYAPDLLAEVEGVAEGAGQPPERLLAINQPDLFDAPPAAQCTSLALAQSGDGPICAKNNDGERNGAAWVIRTSYPDTGLPMVEVTYTGWVACSDAMNAAGLATCHNSVGSRFPKGGERLGIRLWSHQLMRTCRSVTEFAEGLGRVPLTGKGFNIVAADAAGDTCVFEAAVPRVDERDHGGAFVYATNHYASEALADADRRRPRDKRISQDRLGYFRWLAETHPPASSADVQAVLQSHEPWAPCRHGGAHAAHTLWSMVCHCRDRLVLVAPGAPCTTPYDAYPVPA